MSYKSIILAASGSVEDTKTAIVAARLAKRAGSQIRCIPVFLDLAADLVYYGVTLNRAVESAAVDRVRASEQVTQERLETVVREAAQRIEVGSSACR